MGIQNSINSLLGTAAAGQKLTDIAKKGKTPKAGPAAAQPQQKQPIASYDVTKAQTATQFVQSNIQAKKEMLERAKRRRDALGRFTKEGK